jgi:hypothetical protein
MAFYPSQSVFTPLLSYFFLGTSPALEEGLGGAVIVIGAGLRNFRVTVGYVRSGIECCLPRSYVPPAHCSLPCRPTWGGRRKVGREPVGTRGCRGASAAAG